MINRFKKVLSHPSTQEAFKSLKPTKSIWGIASVILLFILPEIVAFVWGSEIKAYTQTQLLQDLPLEKEYYYKGLEMLFTEGSWINLLLGLALLIWLFF